MRAVVIEGNALVLRDLPEPTGTVVDVRAAGVNRADILQRLGKYPSDIPVPGLEIAGTTRDGRRVMALLPGGGYAERVAVDGRMLMPIPEGLSFVEAAAIPEAYLTAWDALQWLKAGETVLIHCGGSGVGTAAIQLAKILGAGRILTTTRSPWKEPKLRDLGAEPVAEFENVDVLLDFVGAAYLERNVRGAAIGGRIVLLGTQGGSRGEIQLAPILTKRLTLIGRTMRGRPIEAKVALTREFTTAVLPHFGSLRPVIDRTFPLEAAAEAHAYLESNRNFGKVVLTVGPR